MTVLFVGLVLLDGWLDGSLTSSPDDDREVRGTILMVLLATVLSLGALELSKFERAKGATILQPASAVGIFMVSTAWYWAQMIGPAPWALLAVALVVALAVLFVQQAVCFGPHDVLLNGGATLFSVLYLGLPGAFALAIRVEVGLWPLLAFVFVVKSSDIGAYTFGKLFGTRKLAPRISPGKTWEGLAGAVIAATFVSIALAAVTAVMSVWWATAFGVCMALAGQLSDMAESMLKRDAGQKDSSNRLPGFGGILDVVDSLLFAAPLAYAVFRMSA